MFEYLSDNEKIIEIIVLIIMVSWILFCLHFELWIGIISMMIPIIIILPLIPLIIIMNNKG